MLHSIARNHALVDGNKRLALAAVIAFYGMNGLRLTLSNENAYALVWMSRVETAMTSRPSPRR